MASNMSSSLLIPRRKSLRHDLLSTLEQRREMLNNSTKSRYVSTPELNILDDYSNLFLSNRTSGVDRNHPLYGFPCKDGLLPRAKEAKVTLASIYSTGVAVKSRTNHNKLLSRNTSTNTSNTSILPMKNKAMHLNRASSIQSNTSSVGYSYNTSTSVLMTPMNNNSTNNNCNNNIDVNRNNNSNLNIHNASHNTQNNVSNISLLFTPHTSMGQASYSSQNVAPARPARPTSNNYGNNNLNNSNSSDSSIGYDEEALQSVLGNNSMELSPLQLQTPPAYAQQRRQGSKRQKIINSSDLSITPIMPSTRKNVGIDSFDESMEARHLSFTDSYQDSSPSYHN